MPRCKMNKTYQYMRLILAVLIGLMGLPMMAAQDIGRAHFIVSAPWGPTLLSEEISEKQDLISSVEYFWDEDPGYGMGTQIDVTPGEEINLEAEIATDDLTPGIHQLGVRTRGETGWSPTTWHEVVIRENADIEYAEYFWDEDPGYGSGTPIAITPGEEINLEAEIATDDLAPGIHQLGVRTRGETGWSPTTWHEVVIRRNANIEYAEYFWNEDPGFGKGKPIAITPGETVDLNEVDIPTEKDLHGDAILGIRLFGATGWSPTMTYKVLLDAEGNYTLNSTLVTDYETRNYQCLADLAYDFSERGIGGAVTITAQESNTEYALDLTADEDLAKVTDMTESLEAQNLWMTFTAAEGTNNVIAVTTANENAETIGKVIRFFLRTRLENISLWINGKSYQLNPLSDRQEEICSAEEAVGIDFGTIADGVSIEWTAEARENSLLTGFATQGTGNLVPGTIMNSGTRLDSLTYSISLKNENGEVLYAYTYIIYVHSKMAGRNFSNIRPIIGSTLDPTSTTLSWDAMDDCLGYELTISSKEDNDELGTTQTSQTIDLTENSYTLALQEGYHYTWNVTAKGYCDEINSGDMTFTTRRLPDLTVSQIVVPEYAEEGNTITVKATITNNGGGSTVKGTWRDYLYYTLDSEDFATAVSSQYVAHNGNIEAGESYEVTFAFKVPNQDNGTLRLFVVTSQGSNEIEQNGENNCVMSEAITLKPFRMNSEDLAALRKLHSDFGGENWNGTPWDTSSELIKSGNWSGVTFNTEGRVTAINLSARALTATLSESNAPQFALLTSLDLSGNSISGDVAKLVSGLPQLTSLNLSYNKLDEVSTPLPTTITRLNLSYQHRIYKSNLLPDIDDMASQTITIGGATTITATTLGNYNHNMQDWSTHSNYDVCSRDLKTTYGSIKYNSASGSYTFGNAGKGLVIGQDAEVVLVATNGTAQGTAYPAHIRYTMGDANISGLVDVNDVQRTLNYMFDVKYSGLMNISAANTFAGEEEAGETPEINVQDIVCTVNIVLESNASILTARKVMASQQVEHHHWLTMNGRTLSLDAQEEVGALDIQLSGVNSKQIRLLLDATNFSMATRDTGDGVRIIIFSPTGMTLPVGTTELVKCSRNATVEGAAGSNAKAEAIILGYGETTGMSSMTADDDIRIVADGHDIVVTAANNHGEATLIIYSETGAIIDHIYMGCIESGTTRRHANIAGSQVYIVKLECQDGTIVTRKLIF